MKSSQYSSILIWGLLLFVLAGETTAQTEEGGSWSLKSQISAIWTDGNSESNTFGVQGSLTRNWSTGQWRSSAGSVRTRSTVKSRRAVGTTESFEVNEQTDSETTAENYFARTRVDLNVTPRMLALAGVDWLRNTFAGIDSRFLVSAGAGTTILDNERVKLKSDYSFSYTFEEEVVDNPFSGGKFPGFRFGYESSWQVSDNSELESTFVGDWNLDNTDDLRLEWVNGLSVAINSTFAIEPSLKLNWRNEPALTSVPLFDEQGEPTGQNVLIPLAKLDSFLNVAIVVTV